MTAIDVIFEWRAVFFVLPKFQLVFELPTFCSARIEIVRRLGTISSSIRSACSGTDARDLESKANRWTRFFRTLWSVDQIEWSSNQARRRFPPFAFCTSFASDTIRPGIHRQTQRFSAYAVSNTRPRWDGTEWNRSDLARWSHAILYYYHRFCRIWA